MNAALLVDGHLIFFEIVVGDALLEDADEQVVGELVLIGEAAGGDGVEAREKRFVCFVALGDGFERVVGELVVVAIVPEGGGALGEVAQVSFVLLIEKGVLSGYAIGYGLGGLGEGCGCD